MWAEFLCRRLDLLRVKGKQKPVEIHQLMTEDTPANRELARRFEAALQLYFNASFAAALAAFQGLLKDYPGDEPSKVFIGRCERFLIKPPPQGWNGVYVAEDK